MKLNVIENFTKETIITPNTIIKGDCLEVMKNIEKGSISCIDRSAIPDGRMSVG